MLLDLLVSLSLSYFTSNMTIKCNPGKTPIPHKFISSSFGVLTEVPRVPHEMLLLLIWDSSFPSFNPFLQGGSVSQGCSGCWCIIIYYWVTNCLNILWTKQLTFSISQSIWIRHSEAAQLNASVSRFFMRLQSRC